MTETDNKRALVIGASGALGTHFARTLARAGMKVALAARRAAVARLAAVAAAFARTAVTTPATPSAAAFTPLAAFATTAIGARALGLGLRRRLHRL